MEKLTPEWIARQRENLTKYKKKDGSIKVAAERQYIISMYYPAALDALEAAYEEIARLTAERDAAVRDLTLHPTCFTCQNADSRESGLLVCKNWREDAKLQCTYTYRGLCAENAPEVSK